MTNSESRQEEINQNKAKFVSIFSELEGLEDALTKARNDLRENLNVSQVLTLKDEIAELELQIDDTQTNAQAWGQKWGKDQELIKAISAEYEDFEWVFERCELD